MVQTIVMYFYIATAVDLLVILLIFLQEQRLEKNIGILYQYLGSIILILVSLFLAFVLNYVPEKWILGLLGLIPIYLGIKVAIYDDCEGEKEQKLNEKGLSKLVGLFL